VAAVHTSAAALTIQAAPQQDGQRSRLAAADLAQRHWAGTHPALLVVAARLEWCAFGNSRKNYCRLCPLLRAFFIPDNPHEEAKPGARHNQTAFF